MATTQFLSQSLKKRDAHAQQHPWRAAPAGTPPLTDVPDISAAVEVVRSAVNADQELLCSQLGMAAAGGVEASMEDNSAFLRAPASASHLPATNTDKAPDACVCAPEPRRQVVQSRATDAAVQRLAQAHLRCTVCMRTGMPAPPSPNGCTSSGILKGVVVRVRRQNRAHEHSLPQSRSACSLRPKRKLVLLVRFRTVPDGRNHMGQ